MKGLFLYYKEIDMRNLTGIDRKVLSQIEEINKNDIKCEIKIEKSNITNFIEKILVRLPFTNIAPKWKYSEMYECIDFIYLRRPTAITKKMINVFKKAKEKNKDLKIIVEIPNYPYDDELIQKIKMLPFYLKDKFNRKTFYKYVDRIAVQNRVNYIFKTKTLNFSNGINFDDIKIRKPEKSNEINICAVASMLKWQGYERVIESLQNYYMNGGQREVVIHFAGDGEQLLYYKKLVKKYNLEKNIIFYGFVTGQELDKIYNKCDLSLDAFGRYKTKNSLSTSLKSREYLAKGLPVVSGSNSDLFSEDAKYYLQFPNNASLFDFNEIIKFYDRIYSNKNKIEVAQEIRKSAFNKCDISVSMREIINYIKNE